MLILKTKHYWYNNNIDTVNSLFKACLNVNKCWFIYIILDEIITSLER